MSDETLVNEEISGKEQQSTVQEEHALESQKEASTEVYKSDSSQNWEQARYVLQMQKSKIEELEQRLSEKDKTQPVESDDITLESLGIDKDDVLTGEKAFQLAEKIAEKKAGKKATEAAEKIVQKYMQQNSVAQDEQRMRSQYEDYDYVVENFAIPQIKNNPALAYQIQNSKNPAETAYKLGKLSDTYEETSMKQKTSPKAEKILKNTQRPVSSNAAGSPLKAQADQFSNMSQQDVWKLSQQYARKA